MNILDRISLLLGDKEQKELTNYLGLKSVAFSEWKSGKSKSYRKYLIEISEFFNVSIDYLVYGESTQQEVISSKNNLLSDEQQLIEDYRDLSEQGQDYIKQQIFMAKEVYKKQSISQVNEKIG